MAKRLATAEAPGQLLGDKYSLLEHGAGGSMFV
jgi:hypothetical protein